MLFYLCCCRQDSGVTFTALTSSSWRSTTPRCGGHPQHPHPPPVSPRPPARPTACTQPTSILKAAHSPSHPSLPQVPVFTPTSQPREGGTTSAAIPQSAAASTKGELSDLSWSSHTKFCFQLCAPPQLLSQRQLSHYSKQVHALLSARFSTLHGQLLTPCSFSTKIN